jgi:hypothetical protein
MKGFNEVEGPACEIKRTGGLLKETTPVDRYGGIDPRGSEAVLAPAAVARGGGVAGDGLNCAPGHGFARGKHLREAWDLANPTMRLHG